MGAARMERPKGSLLDANEHRGRSVAVRAREAGAMEHSERRAALDHVRRGRLPAVRSMQVAYWRDNHCKVGGTDWYYGRL